MGYFQPRVIYREEGVDKKNSILRYIGNRVLRNNSNFLCLSGDTKLYGHTKTLKELWDNGIKDIDTISLSLSRNTPIKSKSKLFYSGKKEVFEIELENGKKIYATSEHKLFKQKGHTFEDVEVKNLMVGDNLRDYDIEWIKKYYENSREYSKEQISKKYNHFKKCNKCNSLIYTGRYRGCKTKKYCKTCLDNLNNKYKEIKNHNNKWLEWEDHLLKIVYMNKKIKEILELYPHRTWEGIMHRAQRLGLSNGKRKTYHFSTKKMTDIEKKIAKFLNKQGIDYKFNEVINNNGKIVVPDFKIDNIIIECDGDYWHKGRKKEDDKRQKYLESLGFIVLRFKGSQINKNFDEVKKCILQKLNL